VAGTGLNGHTGDGGPGTLAKLHHDRGVAVDASGNIYIADAGNNRIRCVTVGSGGGCSSACAAQTGSQCTAGTIITYAFNGKAFFAGDGKPATQASQFNPSEVGVDPAGNLYVGGGPDNVVRRID